MSSKSKKDQNKLVDLSPSEVRHLLRPREGFIPYAKQMLALYAAHPDELSVKGLDLDTLRAELELLDELAPKRSTAERVVEQLRQTELLHESNVFGAALQIYRRAKSAAATDGDMAHAISDIAGFLRARKPRTKKAPTAPPTTTP